MGQHTIHFFNEHKVVTLPQNYMSSVTRIKLCK